VKSESDIIFMKDMLEKYASSHRGLDRLVAQISVNTLCYVLDEKPIYELNAEDCEKVDEIIGDARGIINLVDEARFREFKEALDRNLYFTDEGTHVDGVVVIPQSFFNMVETWSAMCTDPSEGEDYYKNPRAMFVALDLIYRLLNSVEEKGDE